MRTLHFADYVTTGQHCHYARRPLRAEQPTPAHRHDFHEVFWVETGRGIHHINGELRPLEPGRLILVRNRDCHALLGTITIVNIAFATSRWRNLTATYAGDLPDPLTARDHRQRAFTLTPLEFRELSHSTTDLHAGNRTALAIDFFLLNLLRLLRGQRRTTTSATELPEWLATALRQVGTDQQHFQSTRTFARLAGRSPEHLARELRRRTGKTPTDIINEARMTYAARRLIESGDKIMTIALDCGIQNLAYFYRLFQRTYGTAPQAYRRHHQSIVGR